MDDKKFLNAYSGQSFDELITLENEYRIDSLVLAFERAIYQKADKIGIENLTEEELIILAVEALEREVNNGGFDQFFVNTAEFAPIIVDSLKRIGCVKTAEIAQDAINSLGISGGLTEETIEQVIYDEDDTRTEKLGECDDRFYEYKEDIAGCLFEFIKKNKENINIE